MCCHDSSMIGTRGRKKMENKMKKFRSDNKKINQYMVHAVGVESFRDGRMVEFDRGRDAGYAILGENGKVVEIFVRDKRHF